METEFHAGPDGMLVGHYRIHDAVSFDGTLTEFRLAGTCEADFTWHDRDGTGTVHIRFEPELGRFIGHWGARTRSPRWCSTATGSRPNIVS